jgi:uncharacterized protein DUF4260
MKTIIKTEEAAMFLCSIFLFRLLPFEWWVFAVLILAPDMGMLGYIVSPGTGSITYNIFHHKGIALVVGIAGYYFHNYYFMLAGIILFGHSSMDRMFGYGLKYEDSFSNTHLGKIGKMFSI